MIETLVAGCFNWVSSSVFEGQVHAGIGEMAITTI
jgi:hypothetical protein